MSDAVIDNPYLFLMIEHFGIPVPLYDKSIEKICFENKISASLFLSIARFYSGEKDISKVPFSYDDADSIVFFLKNSHVFYLNDIYPDIMNNISQIAEVNDCREVSLLQKFFTDYFNEVTEHLDYEDRVVFPYVLELHDQILGKNKPVKGKNYSVKEYKEHHSNIEEKLNDLKNLILKYLPQKNDQIIRRKLLLNLSELEFDLNIHSQIEDLILIPLVAKMESYTSKII